MASNVIPIRQQADRRKEIQYHLDWRAQIYRNYPKMDWLGQEMATVILGCIAKTLADLGHRDSGEAA